MIEQINCIDLELKSLGLRVVKRLYIRLLQMCDFSAKAIFSISKQGSVLHGSSALQFLAFTLPASSVTTLYARICRRRPHSTYLNQKQSYGTSTKQSYGTSTTCRGACHEGLSSVPASTSASLCRTFNGYALKKVST